MVEEQVARYLPSHLLFPRKGTAARQAGIGLAHALDSSRGEKRIGLRPA